MSSGAVPNTTKAPIFRLPKHPTNPILKPSSLNFSPTLQNHRSPSSFRSRAAIKEGGGFTGTGERSSFYELLGISEQGSFDEVKRAYKQLARKYHPDVSPPDRTEEYTRRFIEVQEAYETLSDPKLRAMYDRDLAMGLHLAFSARRRFDEELEERSRWKSRWQDQVAELRRRSTNKDSGENLSWGARMRQQRADASSSTAAD